LFIEDLWESDFMRYLKGRLEKTPFFNLQNRRWLEFKVDFGKEEEISA
jgi:hypothetical protein